MMSRGGDEIGTGDRGQATPAAAEPTLRWKEAGSRSLAATACLAGSTRDEIALLFGTIEPADPKSQEACVRWLSRILLRPSVAAGLARVLREALQRYEATYGPLEPLPEATGPSDPLRPFAADARHAAGRDLLDQVQALRTPFGFERSFKLSRGSVLANRFLASVKKDMLGVGAAETLTGLCGRLEMPEGLLQTFREQLPEAGFVHFGFEETETSVFYKVYLEFWTNWDDELSRRAQAAEPFLLHLGLKWDRSRAGRTTVTRYTCHPWLSVEKIRPRIGEIYAHRDATPPLDAVLAMAEAASRRTRPGRILYLEVSEDGNPRRSFDVNLYKAGLRVQDLDAWAPRIAAHYALPTEAFRPIYESARPQALGHLAGGLDREGRDFLTIYYGMEAR
jgi:hypothetical protein